MRRTPFSSPGEKMRLNKEQQIEIILTAGSGSSRMVAIKFNRKHGTNITHDTMAKLIRKFQKTGSVADVQPRCGRSRTATDEGTTTIFSVLTWSPTKSTCQLSAESGVCRSSIRRFLKANKWHPYKLHMAQHTSEDDPDSRMEFCEWALSKLNEDANPHWMSPMKMQSACKLMVWAEIWGDRIIGPFFVYGKLNAEKYLNMLQEEIFPSLLNEDGNFPVYFQQDGAPSHYGIHVRQWLDQQFPDAWIGRRGPVEWPPRSPDITPLEFYIWGHLKAMVYQKKIQNINHRKERITDAITSITPAALIRVHQQWQTHIEICFQNNGNHVEHTI